MGLLKKRQSKRISLKDRYKIQKKVNEHNRKQRRQAKKDDKSGATARRALRKDPGIPNLWPFKEQMLKQIEAKKEHDEERKKARQEDIRKRRAGLTEEDLATAEERGKEHNEKEEQLQQGTEEGSSSFRESNSKHAGSVLKTVVEDADVILEVLDARDPIGSRSPQIEDLVRSKGKRLVFVLNKTDLIPESAVKGWLKHLKKEAATIPFACTTQKQKNNLKRVAGADHLIKLLKNYARGSKAVLVVGVVGVPNVGKSSLVNSMKMSRAVIASAQAGSTKSNQRVAIDSKLELIDTPGVSTPYDPSKISKAVAALRACLEPIVQDPLKVVENLIKESGPERFMVEYGVPAFQEPKEFLVRLATMQGKMSRGGVLNLEAAARVIVKDCQSGKLKLFVSPPVIDEEMDDKEEEEDEAMIMENFGEEFTFADEDDTMGL